MHGNKFIFLSPQVMKQTGGLYPAPLKILEVSLVVIIILMQTLLSLYCIAQLLYPQNHEFLQHLVHWREMLDGWAVQKKWDKFFSCVINFKIQGEIWSYDLLCQCSGWQPIKIQFVPFWKRSMQCTGSEGFIGFHQTQDLFWYHNFKRPFRDSVIATEWSLSMVSQALQD